MRAFFLIFILFARLFSAQNAIVISEQSQPKEVQGITTTMVNALMIFTSKDTIGSGSYHFIKKDATLATLHAPFAFTVSSLYDDVELFMLGGAGYSQATRDVILEDSNQSNELAKARLNTYTGGLGLGVRFSSYDIDFETALELIYSRVGYSFDGEGKISEIINEFFNTAYADNYSYRFVTQARYERKYNGFTPYVLFSFSLYDTKSIISTTSLFTFQSTSELLALGFGSESGTLWHYDNYELRMKPYVSLEQLFGDVSSFLEVKNFTTVGLTSYLYLHEKVRSISRLYLDISTTQSDAIYGLNVGVGLSLSMDAL